MLCWWLSSFNCSDGRLGVWGKFRVVNRVIGGGNIVFLGQVLVYNVTQLSRKTRGNQTLSRSQKIATVQSIKNHKKLHPYKLQRSITLNTIHRNRPYRVFAMTQESKVT